VGDGETRGAGDRMAELPFVGEGRRRLVAELAGAFKATCRSDVPRLVTLEAESGSGKTRVMRELYRVLARDHQPGDSFWPEALERGNAPDEDVDSRRKHISPGLVVAPQRAVPAWFWWGVSVRDQRYVRPLQALMEDRHQVSTLAEVLRRRLPARDPAHRQAVAFLGRERLGDGLGTAVIGETLTTVGTLAGVPVPGSSLVQWFAQRVRAVQRDRRDAARTLEDTDAGPRADMVDRFVEELASRIPDLSEHVPFILAVEDLHLADAALVDMLLTTLRAARGRVLVIGSAIPGHLDDQSRDVARLLRDMDEARVTRFRPDTFPALAREDRVELARVRLEEQRRLLSTTGEDALVQVPPEVSDATCVALAERYRTPLALEQVCGLPKVRGLLGRGRLDVDAVEALPEDDPAQIYASMWDGLPKELQAALEVCVLTAPCAQSPALSSRVWDVELALRAGARAGLVDVGPDVLARHASYGWAVPLSGRLWACTEPPQFAVALKRAREDIADILVSELRAGLIAELRDELAVEAEAGSGSGKRQGTVAEQDATTRDFHDVLAIGLALADELLWTDATLAPLRAADRLLVRASNQDKVSLLAEARAVGEIALRHTSSHEGAWVSRAVAVAEMTGRSGSASAAATRLAEVIAVVDRAPTPDAGTPEGLGRNDIELRRAFWLGEAGRLEAAITVLEQLIARCEASDPRPPQFIEARVALASWLGDVARPREAIALLETVLADLPTRGSTADDRIAVHQQLAYWYGEAGETGRAIERLEWLEEQLKELRPTRWLVLQSVRQQHGHWLGIGGDAAAAEALLAALEQERRERLGTRHPDTLSTRNQRWSWAARRGAVHEGVAEFRRLARDRIEVLGSDAPPSQGTRNNLALMLIEAGLHEEAATLLEDVAQRMSDLYTPWHRSAILARANIANLAGIRGDAEAALAGLQQAHADWMSHHLASTRDELALRGNVGVWLDATGSTDDAVALLEQTWAEQRATLGAEDPDTLVTAANLAFIHDHVDGSDPARTRAAAVDLASVLGDAAPETMTAQHNLGHLLLSRGDVDAARDVLTDVLARRTALLGEEHPDTLATAHELTVVDEDGG
jgi:tetratricopeptide (TPR) repeat protein